MYAYIGRQAIYNKDMVIDGYELLYRSGRGGNVAQMADADAATRGVLNDAVNVFGLTQLTNGLPVYINFTRNLLLEDFAYLADPKDIVVEVPGEVSMDDALVNKFAELRRAGYRLALDGYSEFNGIIRFDEIIQMFDVIRVNMGQSGRLQVSTLLRRLRRAPAKLLAERVETEEDFDIALNLNFSLFQGYFFEKPSTLSKQIPALAESVYGQLINELLRPSVNYDRCAAILRSDLVLTYMFLRRTRTGVYRGDDLSDIKQGMMNMGTEELRRWVSLVLLKQGNAAPSDELARKAYARGLFIERLMEHSTTSLPPAQGFLMGVFSLLPQVMGLQMQDLLEGMNLEPELKAALQGGGGDSEYATFLTYAVLYEMANPRLILPDIRCKLAEGGVSKLYMSCTADADTAFSGDGPAVATYRGNLVR